MLQRARRRLHRLTTGTDGGQLTIWASIALAAGALPDLLLGASTTLGLPQHSLLIAGWVIAAGLAGIYAIENLRRRGIAVFVHLPGRGDAESPLTELAKFADIVHNKHRTWFRTGPEPATERVHATDRIRWTFTTIEHRLAESTVAGFTSEPLFLYLQCHQEEAVELGRQLHAQVVGQRTDALFARTSLEVRYISRFSGLDDIHRIDLSQSFSSIPHRSICQIDTVDLSNTATHVTRPARVALVLRAGHASQSNPQAFVATALCAAAGETSTPYYVTEADSCSWAVVAQIDTERLVELLRDGTAHTVVAEIRDAYRNLCREQFGLDSVPVRLLSDGFTILLMAMAAVIGDVRLIPWNTTSSAPTTSGLFALIDGDDVGARMEHLLLNNERLEAMRHSTATDGAMATLVNQLSALPGVTHLSTGGDSALFSLDRNSVQAFADELSQQRAALDFRISCGIGESTSCAFVALRSAKTSGKNRTEIQGTSSIRKQPPTQHSHHSPPLSQGNTTRESAQPG